MEQQTSQNQTALIMKELSDIKASLAVNTNETANIKQSISDIKIDIKEIKNDFINRREFSEAITEIHNEISPLKRWIYGFMSTIGIAVLGAILKLVIK